MALDYATDDDMSEGIEDDAVAPEERIALLQQFMASPNIADMLEEDELKRIGQRVCEEYKIDCESRSDWEDKNETAFKQAMLIAEEKTYPWPNASNVKHPLLAQAAFEFNARSYPAIVQGNRVAKCNTWGDDPDGSKAARADRVSEHLSYQLLSEMDEWEEDTDRLLVMLPIAGCVFRKVWYDPALARKVSRLVTADNLVINYWARSLASAPRITERLDLYPYEIQERILSGRFKEFDYDGLPKRAGAGEGKDDKKAPDENDTDAPHRFLEQHRQLDLDGDGYPEPYIVTVHEGSQKVCRIVANYDQDSVRLNEGGGNIVAIRKRDFYIKYAFLPNPEGAFYDVGFGYLLRDILESINTTINQMIDAGKLANMQGGLVSSVLGLREKSISLKPGEWKMVNASGPINQAIMPIQYPGPNATLFSLLGFLMETGEGIAAIKDVLTGEGVGKNASPTTTLALIEQGLQVFTAIFKRVHRALKTELGIHARLNRENPDLDGYNALFDGQRPYDPVQDYAETDKDILPVSDPNVASRMQELAGAQFLLDTGLGNEMINQEELMRRVYKAANVEDVDKLIVPPPPPDPITQALTMAMAQLELEDKQADIIEKMTSAIENIAKAEAEEEGQQLGFYELFIRSLQAQAQMEQQEAMNGQAGLRGMAGQPGNAMGNAPVAGNGAGAGGTPAASASQPGIGSGTGTPPA